jgi:hypothetical protein
LEDLSESLLPLKALFSEAYSSLGGRLAQKTIRAIQISEKSMASFLPAEA